MLKEQIKINYEILKQIGTFTKNFIEILIKSAILVMGSLTALYCTAPTLFKLRLKTTTSLDLDFLNSLELLELKEAQLKKTESLLLEAEKKYNTLLNEKGELEMAYSKSQAEREVFSRQLNLVIKGWSLSGTFTLLACIVGVSCAGVYGLHLYGVDTSAINRILLSAISASGSIVGKALLPHIIRIEGNTKQTHDALEEHLNATAQQNNLINSGIRLMLQEIREGNARD